MEEVNRCNHNLLWIGKDICMTHYCPGQRWFKLSSLPDSADLQLNAVNLSAGLDSAESMYSLSWSMRSQYILCPGQRWVNIYSLSWKTLSQYIPGLGKHSFQKKATFSRSFEFFSKERNILTFFCNLYKKNAVFFAFFYILYKRTLHSLRSFTFFITENGVLWVLLRSL